MADARSLASVLLVRWRQRLNLSQTKAAAQLNVDQARYSQFERGVRKPGRSAAVRIAQGTGGDVPVEAWDLPAPPAPLSSEASDSPPVQE